MGKESVTSNLRKLLNEWSVHQGCCPDIESRKQLFSEVSDVVTINASAHTETWDDKDNVYWLSRLLWEVGDLGLAINGHSSVPMENSLIIIGGIVFNWLRRLESDS